MVGASRAKPWWAALIIYLFPLAELKAMSKCKSSCFGCFGRLGYDHSADGLDTNRIRIQPISCRICHHIHCESHSEIHCATQSWSSQPDGQAHLNNMNEQCLWDTPSADSIMIQCFKKDFDSPWFLYCFCHKAARQDSPVARFCTVDHTVKLRAISRALRQCRLIYSTLDHWLKGIQN